MNVLVSCVWNHFRLLPRLQRRDDDADDDRGPRYFFPSRLPRGRPNAGYLPVRLFIIMMLMQRAFAPSEGGEIMCADFFAGKCAISKAYVRKGYKAVAMDICLDPKDEPQLQKRYIQKIVNRYP